MVIVIKYIGKQYCYRRNAEHDRKREDDGGSAL